MREIELPRYYFAVPTADVTIIEATAGLARAIGGLINHAERCGFDRNSTWYRDQLAGVVEAYKPFLDQALKG